MNNFKYKTENNKVKLHYIKENFNMLFNKSVAKDYLEWMQNMAIQYLNNPNMFYYKRKGHLRMAREMGRALDHYDEEGRNVIISESYGMVYVVGCAENNIEPIISEQEWLAQINYIIETRSHVYYINLNDDK